MNFKHICSELLIRSDQERAEQMSAYLNNRFRFIGIRAQERKQITADLWDDAKKEVAEQGLDTVFIDACLDQNFREFQYITIEYLNQVKDELKVTDLETVKRVALHQPWWDTVDACFNLIGYLAYKYPEVKEEVRRWAESDNIWLRRLAILHQNGYFEHTDPNLLAEILDLNYDHDALMVRRAVEWALKQYAKIDADWVDNYRRQHDLTEA